MKRRSVFFILGIMTVILAISCRMVRIPESEINEVFSGRSGILVLVDCVKGSVTVHGSESADEKLAPCSTFKIWNTLIGLETGLIKSADDPFYVWDGVERSFPVWNHDLTLIEAFQASCVPAFQDLARRIGPDRMQSWIDKIGYGDRDISAGVDVFWLPGREWKTLLISPIEQANLMERLISGKLPFSDSSLSVLKNLMFIKATHRGTLYGKTGSGADLTGEYILGWFVGYLECASGKFAFSCAVQGKNVMGKDARIVVESLLEKEALL